MKAFSYKEYATRVSIENIVKIKANTQGVKQNLKGAGNRISVIDNNNRMMEQFTVGKILTSASNNRNLFENSIMKYVDSTIKGHNLLVMCMGSGNSGKEGILFGNKSEAGLISIFTENLFASIDIASSNKSNSMAYTVRFRFVEIVDEKLLDLFSEKKYTQLEVIEEEWEGPTVEHSKWLSAADFNQARQKLQTGIRNRINSISELAELAGKSSSMFTIELCQRFSNKDGISNVIISKVMFCELPSLDVLKSNQEEIRIRQENVSIKGIISLVALLKQLSENPRTAPLYETSKLTLLLKDYLGGNAFAVAILGLANGDPDGNIKTLKCIRYLNNIAQFPIFNNGESIGLLRKFRLEGLKDPAQQIPPLSSLESEKQIIESNLAKIRSEDDYRRILEKYTDLKNKYNESLKKKTEIQFQLIKAQEEKLEISKALVDIQIENTKLMEELQNKDYQIGRKMIKAETSIIQKEVANNKYSERIKELEESLTEAVDARKELEIEFIALKKNFLMQQKQIQQLKKNNEALGLDVINLNNETKYLNDQLTNKLKSSKSSTGEDKFLIDRYERLKKEFTTLEENEKYLKSEVERYRNEVVKYQLSLKQNNIDFRKSASSSKSYDYDKIELQNEKIELNNKIKLMNRKVEELEEQIDHLRQDNAELLDENQKQRQAQANSTENYRNKLSQIAKSADPQSPVTQLTQNFTAAERKYKQKINDLNKKVVAKKNQLRSMLVYARQLKYLAEEWAPKGIQLPELLTNPPLELNESQPSIAQVQSLKVTNKQLVQQLAQLKKTYSRNEGKSVVSNERIQEQINFLKSSRMGNQQLDLIRKQRNELKEQNRKLVGMLKDGNKLETTALVKENQSLKRQLDHIKSKESVSPNSNDQKLMYYEKHLKKLQKQRSELIVRCTMAEEQLKSFQEHFDKKQRQH